MAYSEPQAQARGQAPNDVELSLMDNTPESIGAAIARIPSGCSILTVEHAGRSTGMLVSWVQQAAFAPPSITVAVKQGRPANLLIDAAQRFVLNVVGEDPKLMFKHFGKGFSLEEDAFFGRSVERHDFGPLLTECIAQLGCRCIQRIPAGDHDLLLAEVVWARASEGSKPYVHLRKSGLSY